MNVSMSRYCNLTANENGNCRVASRKALTIRTPCSTLPEWLLAISKINKGLDRMSLMLVLIAFQRPLEGLYAPERVTPRSSKSTEGTRTSLGLPGPFVHSPHSLLECDHWPQTQLVAGSFNRWDVTLRGRSGNRNLRDLDWSSMHPSDDPRQLGDRNCIPRTYIVRPKRFPANQQ